MSKKAFVNISIFLVSFVCIFYSALAKGPVVTQCNSKLDVKNSKTMFGASDKAWKCFSDSLVKCQPATIYGSITIKSKTFPIYYSVIGMEGGNCHVSGPTWSEYKDDIKGANCFLPDKFLSYIDNGKDLVGYSAAAGVVFERYSPDHIKYCLNDVKVDKCSNENTQDKKDACYIKESDKSFSALECQKIKNSDSRDVCYSNISNTIPAAELCEKIISKKDKLACFSSQGGEKRSLSVCKKENSTDPAKQNQCIAGLAFSKRDFSLCDQVGEKYKAQCFMAVASGYFDPSICDKYIKDSRSLGFCYNRAIIFSPFVKKENCKKLGTESTSCYYALATKTGDATLCDLITDGNYKKTCKANLVADTSLSGQCLKLENKDKQIQCLNGMASGAKDANICNDLYDNVKNSTSITNEVLSVCGSVVGKLGNEEACDKLKDVSSAGACLGNLALAKKDPSYCTKIKYGQKKIECINEYVKIYKDATMCDKYTNQQDGNLCYSIVAAFLKDKVLCDKIKDKVSAKVCNAEVQ